MTTKLGFLLLILIVVVSCKDPEPVNEEYLKSEGYQQFSKSQQKEYSTRVKNRLSLKKYLTKLAHCDLQEEKGFPIHIDRNILQTELYNCNQLSSKFKNDFSTRYIGYTKWKETVIRWLLLQQKSIYEDTELVAVTYQNDTLKAFQTVGIFKQNLQQNISTTIEVLQSDDHVKIKSAIDRGIKYPFKHDNVVQKIFQIDVTGNIEEQDEQAISYNSLPKILKELNSCTKGKGWNLPVEINEGVLKSETILCDEVNSNYHSNFSVHSIGYTTFRDFTVRFFDMSSNMNSENRIIIAGSYENNELISFQTIGKFQTYSLNLISDTNISSIIEVHQKGEMLYIFSSITHDRSFPIKQKESVVTKYVLGPDGNIREI